MLQRLKEIVDDDDSDSLYDPNEILSRTSSTWSTEDENSIKNYDDQNELKTLKLHDQVANFDEGCPPPIDFLPYAPGEKCNCLEFGQEECVLFIDNGSANNNFMDWEEILENAKNTCRESDRKGNNTRRKELYRRVWSKLDFFDGKERNPLPNCAVAKIRQCYPDENGYYQGFMQS